MLPTPLNWVVVLPFGLNHLVNDTTVHSPFGLASSNLWLGSFLVAETIALTSVVLPCAASKLKDTLSFNLTWDSDFNSLAM